MEAAVSGLLEGELSEAELGEAIRGLREHGTLRGEGSSSSLMSLLSNCNSRLLSPVTRTEGLSLLSLVVEECPTDVFQQHCISWIRAVLQVIQSPDPPRVISLAVFVLRSLLAHSSALPELSREISTNHIPGLLTSLLGLRRQCLMPALEGIRSCLIAYPRACGSLRGKLTAFFLSLLDDENAPIQEVACQCFSLLPSLGSGFSQGVKHTENWERQIHSVLCSLHAIFQQLYQGAETDTTRYEGPGSELDLPLLEEEEGASSVLQLVRRFSALTLCLRLLLREQFPAPVRVPVSDILSLVCRVLNVSAKNLSWQGEESVKLLVLPRVHLSALDILEATFTACGLRLLPFSTMICRLFPQILSSWASVRGSGGILPGQERPYSTLRAAVYRVLERWVTVCGVSSGIMQGMSHHADILLAHLLSDINPPADSVKISGFVQLGAKKQKVSEVGNGDFQNFKKREVGANTELCTAALRVLSCVILYGGALIKEDTHRRLQEFSIPLLLRLQQGPDQWIGPYSSGECRKQLYRLLLSLILTPSPRLAAPLHCAVRIFRGGLAEESYQVSMFCTEALAICRVIIHPRVPSLQRPLPQHVPRPPLPPEIPTQRLPVPAPPVLFPAPPPANHIPIRAPAPPQPIEPPATLPVPSPQETFGGKAPRPVFIHYEKEEASDIEISLDSDSDDSVEIVPKGFLQKPAQKPEPSPPSAKPPTEETTENAVTPGVPSPITAALPQQAALPPACPGPAPPQISVATEAPTPLAPLPPPLPPPPPPAQPSEGDMVININSTDDEEEEDEDEEEMYDEEEDEYYDEEEDLEGLDEEEEEEEDFEDEEGLSEEEEEEEDLEGEEEEEIDEEGLMHEEMRIGHTVEAVQDVEAIPDEEAAHDVEAIKSVEAIQNMEAVPHVEPVPDVEAVKVEAESVEHEPEQEEGPPRLSPVQDEEGGDSDLLMVVESEEPEGQAEDHEDQSEEPEVTSSPPPVLSPPPPQEAAPSPDVEDAEPEDDDYMSSTCESVTPIITGEPVKENQQGRKVELIIEEEDDADDSKEEIRDAESMLADFIDCPPDEDDVPRSST